MPAIGQPEEPESGAFAASEKFIRVRSNLCFEKWLTATEAGGSQLRRIEA
jgi:hypothetical protein